MTDLAKRAQSAILQAPPALGRSLTFHLRDARQAAAALRRLGEGAGRGDAIIGLGEALVRHLGREIPGLRTFPALSGQACVAPSTQEALWVFLRGGDRTTLFDAGEATRDALAAAFLPADTMDTFVYAGGRDLTGYEDGTENPKGDAVPTVALVRAGAGLAGSSFVAVQRWVHDLRAFRAQPAPVQDAMIGRRRDTNEEIATAPPSAHVKRSAQESFDPPAFMVRRSMPWATADAQGLEFIAFGDSLDRFERVLRRMAGLEDGIVDALFRFSRPLTGGYYWCPPVRDGRLDLTAVGL
ncbi:MAG: Dyp-type peroxidase [Alphaproteobacteria bacterium]|nr:Dyp-type peroxidase [Alphaproteobacteria bacterium]